MTTCSIKRCGKNSKHPFIKQMELPSTSQNSTLQKSAIDMEDERTRRVSYISKMNYEALIIATDNWNEANILGRGGFGQVYKGELEHLTVAVKRLREDDQDNIEMNKNIMISEMIRNQYRHDNILPLYGYSIGGPRACLVYQLMEGGTLDERLRSRNCHPPLTWPQRYRIAHGVARGLRYLHNSREKPLIHCNVKPRNILLDLCLNPKITGFEIAKEGPPNNMTYITVSRVFGTLPYAPDEYLHSNELSPAVDVFSFGVVMLEMATALPAFNQRRSPLRLSAYIGALKRNDVNLATLEDPVLRNTQDSNSQICCQFIDIGLHCTRYMRHDRPTMIEVDTRFTNLNFLATVKGIEMENEMFRSVAGIPKMSYEELKTATDNWNEANVLGRGGFGQVFKGEWKHLPVAVKRLRDDDRKNKELISEMILNQYRHDNILPLYGYSLGGPRACLVYQLMAGGSLEKRLSGRASHPPLTWPQRYQIAHGVARGLQFLHNMCGTPLIHGDIKPGNILLDQCLMPKIGDFGLAKKGFNSLKVSKLQGTRAYLPEEYLRSNVLSTAVDVFSFGVVLLELATGLPASKHTWSSPCLSSYICSLIRTNEDFEDPALRRTPESNPPLCWHFINIGLHCTRRERCDRPTMLETYKLFVDMELLGKQIL